MMSSQLTYARNRHLVGFQFIPNASDDLRVLKVFLRPRPDLYLYFEASEDNQS